MEDVSSKAKSEPGKPRAGTALINDDLLHNILSRLPATSFASAACVSKSWNHLCNRILSRPRLASALSLDPSPHIAVQEVLEKVLSEPIRPHFAVANIGSGFSLLDALRLITKRLGSRTPFIISSASGIIGRDALTNELLEVKWEDIAGDSDNEGEYLPAQVVNHGIVLTVGFVPGLKVDAIPLLRILKEPRVGTLDKFVMDIKEYTASVSGSTSPVGIILFGEGLVDMKPVIDALDYAMPRETVIVGDERGRFLYRSWDESRNVCGSTKYLSDAVALVFARDKDKPSGNIQFHVAFSNGLSAVGPKHRAVSVRVNKSNHTTWLTARREGQSEILDGQRILHDINNELEDRDDSPDLYIGVTKRRNIYIKTEKPRSMTSLAFHGVIGGDEEYLYVNGVNIRTGDYFQFYHSDPDAAVASCSDAFLNLKSLTVHGNANSGHDMRAVAANTIKKEVFGGFIFSCYGRGESFFGRRNVDSSPFTENFPGVSLAGIFCGGEIGRSSSSSITESNGESSAHCCLHVYSSVYLVMSYTSTSLEHS